jgi:pyruvate dehydrogenase E1 component alpha subunit
MEKKGELTEEALHKLDEEIKAEVQDALDFAEKSPEPPLESLFEDVMVETTT